MASVHSSNSFDVEDGGNVVGAERPEDIQQQPKPASASLFVPAISNMSTAYNLVIITYALLLLSELYPAQCTQAMESAISSSTLAGAIFGQLSFGYVGDLIGRRKGMILTLTLTAVTAFACALLTWGNSTVLLICLFRFFLGVGVGGVYPLSATSAAENTSAADQAHRGRRLALVFAFQGWGQLSGPICVLIIASICSNDEISWRLMLGVGFVLPLIVLRNAIVAKESESFKAAAHKKPSLIESLKKREYWPRLIGTAGGWFLFDITFYGNLIFQPKVLGLVFDYESDDLISLASYAALCYAIALPGYYISALYADQFGRRNIQLMGFAVIAALFFFMGATYHTLTDYPYILFILYAMTFLFSNFGPNATTFILPSESFPTEVRGAFNGFSAAMGKLGATLGAIAFDPVLDAYGLPVTLSCCGVVSLLGFVCTWFFVEDRRGRALDDFGPTTDAARTGGGAPYEPLENDDHVYTAMGDEQRN